MKRQAITTKELQTLLASSSEQARQSGAQHFMNGLEEWFPWYTARHLDGMSIKMRKGDCLITLRGHKPKDPPEVAFVSAANAGQIWWAIAHSATHDLLRWKPDRYSKD